MHKNCLKTISLADMRFGEKGNIIDINAGIGMKTRLEEMGLRRGSVIELVTKTNGPLFVLSDHTRIAIGRGMAQKIIVEIK